MILNRSAVCSTWCFLGAITAVEAFVILSSPRTFIAALSLRAAATPTGWVLAAIVTAATIVYTTRALNIRPLLTRITPFKALGLLIAIPSSILEEAFFRMTVMNVLAHDGYGITVQVVASAVTFGAVHAAWAVKGGVRSLMPAVISTTLLGAALALVYLTSGRALLPSVLAHFTINVVLEPWIAYAYALRVTKTEVPVMG